MSSFGLIGGRLGHSVSKFVHENLWTDDYGMWELTPEELPGFMTSGSWQGINVTIPYKRDVMSWCDSIDEKARKIGCVNTIVRRGGRLCGYNTDYDGFAYMARTAGVSFRGKKVLILGSGATSLTAQAVVRDSSPERLTVISRHDGPGFSCLGQFADAQVIINTTPVGMFPDNGKKLTDITDFPDCEHVIDVVYNPLRTAFILDAAAHGVPGVSGLPMLIMQAVKAAGYFCQRTFDEEEAEALIKKTRRSMENIVLVGMPGSGKSTVGKLIAGSMGRPFFDSDETVVSSCGCDIPSIFENEGEAGFREKETAALALLTKKSGAVIATGGGCVKSAHNRDLLRQNSRVYFIERPLTELARDGRPLSAGGAILAEMYRERLPLYLGVSDVVCPAGTPEWQAESIRRGEGSPQ